MNALAERLAAEHGADAVSERALCGRETPVVAPADAEGACAVLHRATADGLRVLPLGRGTKLDWIAPPARVDLALSTRRLASIEYEPGDGTVTAGAGMSMTALATAVAAGGHVVTPAVAGAERATLGGVIALGQSGVDRLRYGPLRHHVLGLEVAQPDGARTRSGGRLVKNVTGFELHRLYAGSRGSLAVILGASLRLFPRPDALAVLVAPARDAAHAQELARALLAELWQPLAVAWTRGADGAGACRVHVALCGRGEQVALDAARARELLGAEVELAEGEAAAERLAALRERPLASDTWAPLALAARPSRLAAALAALETLWPGAALLVHPGLASAELRPNGAGSSAASSVPSAEEVARARERLAPHAARLRVRGPLLARGVSASGPEAPGVALARRLRAALDPRVVLAPSETASALGPRPSEQTGTASARGARSAERR